MKSSPQVPENMVRWSAALATTYCVHDHLKNCENFANEHPNMKILSLEVPIKSLLSASFGAFTWYSPYVSGLFLGAYAINSYTDGLLQTKKNTN